MSKVVAINGAAVPEPGVPDKNIVELLERHLADAKSGRTVAVAVCSVDSAGWVLGEFDMLTHRYALAGAVLNLLHKLNTHIVREDECH